MSDVNPAIIFGWTRTHDNAEQIIADASRRQSDKIVAGTLRYVIADPGYDPTHPNDYTIIAIHPKTNR